MPIIKPLKDNLQVGDIVELQWEPSMNDGLWYETNYYMVVELHGLRHKFCLISIDDLQGYMGESTSENDYADSNGFYNSLEDITKYLKKFSRCAIYHDYSVNLNHSDKNIIKE